MLWEVYPQALFELESWLFFRLKHLFSHPKPHYWPSLACKKEDKWAYIDCKLKKPTGLDLETQITLLKKKKKKKAANLACKYFTSRGSRLFCPWQSNMPEGSFPGMLMTWLLRRFFQLLSPSDTEARGPQHSSRCGEAEKCNAADLPAEKSTSEARDLCMTTRITLK